MAIILKRLEPIEYNEDGSIKVVNIDAYASNADWIRAARLAKKAEAGDDEARRELEELDLTPMYAVIDTDEEDQADVTTE